MKTSRLSSMVLLVVCAWLIGACAARATPAPTPTAAATPQPPPPATLAPRPATATPSGPSPAQPRQPAAVSPVGMDGQLVTGTAGQPWWNDTTFYEVFVRSFYDSDGDGVGDLQGLIQKLDYLNDGDPNTGTDLGVTGIWLMPIMQSPSYHGYDVVDYYAVDDAYGDAGDFRQLMAEAHRRGIRVIIDLVLNHTSSQHPWFLEAQTPDAPKRDWYVWADEQPAGKGWHRGQEGGYYYGYFWDGMPDLNYNNPAVTEEMLNVTRFWLEEMGVDGFRLDAIKYLYEDGAQIEHLPATHDWLKDFYTFYKGINPQAFTVGEVWDDSLVAAKYVGDKMDIVFEFNTAAALLQSARGGQKNRAEGAQKWATAQYPPHQLATFLTNHDQNRVRSGLREEAQAKTAASLLFAFQGVPFIYYGEEIGMQGTKPDENIRRPMQWTAAGGFTAGAPWNAYFEDFAERNVAAQEADPGSILNHYRAWIALRNQHEALRAGAWLPVTSDQRAVYAAIRATEREKILVLINLGAQPVREYGLTLDAGPLQGGDQPVPLMGEGAALYAPGVNAQGGFTDYRPVETLAPYSTYVLQFQP